MKKAAIRDHCPAHSHQDCVSIQHKPFYLQLCCDCNRIAIEKECPREEGADCHSRSYRRWATQHSMGMADRMWPKHRIMLADRRNPTPYRAAKWPILDAVGTGMLCPMPRGEKKGTPGGYSQLPHCPFRRTSVTTRFAAAPLPAVLGVPRRSDAAWPAAVVGGCLGVIETLTSSKQETSPQVRQTKWGCSAAASPSFPRL